MAAPKNNNYAGNALVAKKALTDALAINDGEERKEGVEKYNTLVNIWLAQIDSAVEGDLSAAREIFDRLDGKPKQALVGGDENDHPIRVQEIERVIVDAKDTDG